MYCRMRWNVNDNLKSAITAYTAVWIRTIYQEAYSRPLPLERTSLYDIGLNAMHVVLWFQSTTFGNTIPP
jgi:hypothetical protein